MVGYFNSHHHKPSEEDMDNYFTKIDLNNDGKIDF